MTQARPRPGAHSRQLRRCRARVSSGRPPRTVLASTLWTGRPLIGEQADGSAVIVYATMTPPAGLLGHTRASVLKLVFKERTTTELARELGVSAATVSGHTKALRAARLIVTMRAGKAVLHSVTPLGDRLLESAGSSPSGCHGG